MKRAFDIVASALALLLLSPVLACVALLVALKMGRPIFFRQQRPGLDEKPFTMLKFRTMLDAHDAKGQALSDAQRLTPFGQWLRSTSLDELPELWNVLKGDLSLVGPRPLLMQYLPRYSSTQRRRHEVRPGLTGWAQIRYPYGASADDAVKKLQYDLYYVKNYSIFLDLLILFQTAEVVLLRKGAH